MRNIDRDSPKRLVSRRWALKGLGAAALLTGTALNGHSAEENPTGESARATGEKVNCILDSPVLRLDGLDQPVMVQSLELLKHGKNYLMRSVSREGVEAITVPNPARMAEFWPIVLKRLIPVFVGQDARQIESLL